MLKKNKILLFLTVNGIALTAAANEYVVCKDVEKGKIKCEDGYYIETGETASELKKPLANFNDFQVRPTQSANTVKRINSLMDELKSKSNGKLENMTSNEIIALVANAKSIESSRVNDLVKELKSNTSGKYIKPSLLLEQIVESKVMI